MNKAILIGNLTRDPEMATTSSGVAKCSFTLAVQRKYANAQGVREADFIPVVCWRQTAELCGKYLSKGRKAAVEGTIQTRSYDAQDGTKRYVTEVIAENVEFLTARSADPGPTPPPEQPRTYGAQENYAGARQDAQSGRQMHMHEMRGRDEFTEVDDDELPF